MEGQDAQDDQLLQTQTTSVPTTRNHDSHLHQHHHHHHHHHHKHHHSHDHEEGDETIAGQTMMTEVENADLHHEDEPEKVDDDEDAIAGVPLGNFMFCDSVRKFRNTRSRVFRQDDMQTAFYSRNQQPSTTNSQSFTKGHLAGRIMVSSLFHIESNRENRGAEDDGMDDADLTAADGIVRAKKERNTKKQVVASDNLKIMKGDFMFPHRTYKPKCQIAFRVPPGQVPQAVMAERLHRIYKKTDINLVLQTLGIELSDLIPPPTYGENNERFYEEMMFRNRTKINGIDKREVLARGGRLKSYAIDGEEEEEEGAAHMHKAENDSTLSSVSSSASGSDMDEDGQSSSKNTKSLTDGHGDEEGDTEKGKAAIHPFIQSKPPFNAQFPLNFFDNSEYDIRSGEDWCRLGWEDKEKRFYPLPGKAFIPLPLQTDKRSKAQAPSELTLEEILKKTPRLERFRQWLLRERFNRQIRMVGLDPTKVTKLSPSDMEMTIVARLGSTVETMASLSDDSIQEIHKAAKRFSQQRSKMDGELQDLSEATVQNTGSDEGEGEGQSSSDPDILASAEAKDEDQLNIVFKLRQPKRDDDMSDEDDKKLTQNDDAKKSVSLLSDVFSDLDSLTMLGSDIITNIQRVTGLEVEATDAEDIDEDTEKLAGDGKAVRGLNRPARSYFMGDYGINIPSSPDIDPFEDGLEQYVMDFDKMKKVHIYDWRWVDVAVFDYHPGQDKYFVRSINAPIVYAWVSKIYLCFDAEDPNKHGMRIKDAVKRRFEMENVMRYNLYVDCLPMMDFADVNGEVMQRIIARAVTASGLKFTDHDMNKVKREINLEYQRTIAEEKFERLTEKHHKTFYPWVQIPDKHQTAILTTTVEDQSTQPAKTPHDFLPSVNLLNFEFKVNTIQKTSVIYTAEAWKPYREIANICLQAREKHIILTEDLLPMHLDDWGAMQTENIEEIKRFLDEEWYEMVVTNLRSNFEKTNKSWYNLSETNYDVFVMSKLCNFLELIKLMLQDTLRSIVSDSCGRFMQQIKAFSVNIDPNTDWSWGDDLINSEYPPPKDLKPLWVLEMYLDVDGPK